MKKILSLIIVALLIFSASAVYADFSDFSNEDHAWAYESVSRLTQNGVINGYEDGTFRPQSDITRAEFAKIVTAAFKLDGGKKTFSDISDHWAKEYIEKSSDMIYSPNEDYKPDEAISRAEIAYALTNILKLEKADGNLEDEFTDADTVNDDLKKNVFAAYKNGIIIGYENSEIRGNIPVTRAECAVLITRALDFGNSDKPSDEKPGKDDGDNKDDSKDPLAELDPIYRLNPGEDVLIVLSMTSASDAKSGDDVYKIKYTLAGKDGEYESVLPDDTEIHGAKSSIGDISNGDVLLVYAAVHCKIRFLYVLTSFEKNAPSGISSALSVPSGSSWGEYGSGKEYEVIYGKVTAYEKKNKSYNISIDDGSKTQTVSVKNSLDADIFSPRRSTWSKDSVSSIDEGQYVFIRFTDGSATELIIGDYK